MQATVLTFDVILVDGDGYPVTGADVNARFRFPSAPAAWSTARTDADGRASFHVEHPEAPLEVCLYVDDAPCGSYQVESGDSLVLEL